MRKHLSDWDADEDLLLRKFGDSLDALRSDRCPDPRMLPALAEGVLPEENCAAIRAHLEGCACCRQLVANMAALPEEEVTPEARNRILARVLTASKTARPEPRTGRSRRLWWWSLVPAAAAAALVIVVATGRQESAPETASTPIQQPSALREPLQLAALIPLEKAPIDLPMEAMLTWRTEPDPYYQALVEALVPYKEGRYDEAAARLEQVANGHPKRAEAQLYLGVCHLLRGNPGGAVQRLETAVELSSDEQKRAAAWYLSQGHLHQDNAAAAADRLRPLCAAPGAYQLEACGALELLDKTRKE